MDFLKILEQNMEFQLEELLKVNNLDEEVNAQSLLFWAVFHNRIDFVKKLIEEGTDVNCKDNIGRTPFSIACYFDFIEISRFLIESDAKIDAHCVERAYHGWDGHIQIGTLNLLQEYGWINLYLDDLRDIPEGFVGVKTIEDAIAVIRSSNVHILSLDHDLGMNEEGKLHKTGYDLVKIICETRMRPANRIYIHTDNVVGRDNMYQTLLAAQRRGFIDDDIVIYPYPLVRNRYTHDKD
ncbi:ankyrin repeat domain-containing protein [Heyndrickxia ginsengihumi]|uniref:ankyrin repeat domain-containing protein n=1 Tax=Heyndrickxia ginsengihumi TaxID=363870 RepID=UPI00046EEE60|nr:ankyrin repeat domain-containing protein [Heyndrickxia ginsengihumi]